MTKLVYDSSEGGRDMKDLLGGKGVNRAEITSLGLPVPPGFLIHRGVLCVPAARRLPAALAAEVDEHLAAIEAGRMGRRPAADRTGRLRRARRRPRQRPQRARRRAGLRALLAFRSP